MYFPTTQDTMAQNNDIDIRTELLDGRQCKLFRDKYPDAYVEHKSALNQYGELQSTSTIIYNDSTQKQILTSRTVKGKDDPDHKKAMRECLKELGCPLITEEFFSRENREIFDDLIRQEIQSMSTKWEADAQKILQSKVDLLEAATAEYQKAIITAQAGYELRLKNYQQDLRQRVQIEAYQAVREIVANSDAPKGFWQCWFDRFGRKAPAAAINDGTVRLSLKEWRMINQAERELDSQNATPDTSSHIELEEKVRVGQSE